MITRRHFLKIVGGLSGSLVLPGCAASSLPFRKNIFPPLDQQTEPFLGLATSLPREYDYEASTEGSIPEVLRGTLYRNTTGLFERGGLRKRSLLDGDGMVQSFRFHDDGVRFRNKFVQTEKYGEESAAGKFIYPTFSTQAPGGVLANFWPGKRIKSQAQITVIVRNGKLFAFDESTQPYELDPETLDTVGISYLGLPEGTSLYSAHSKIDEKTGEWFHFGLHYGRKVNLHITVFAEDGRLQTHRTIELPRYVHIHDFFVSDRHMIFLLHPLEIHVVWFLLGMKSMADCLVWKPEAGNLLLLVRRDDDTAPVHLQAEAAFMWHSINACEKNGEIIADFIGYRNPDHFLGPDAPILAVMQGRKGSFRFPGEIRRYIIGPARKTLREETLLQENHEWPMIYSRYRCHKYRFCYAASSRGSDFFWSGITRLDTKTGKTEDYFFEKGLFCGEPVFAPLPGFPYDPYSGEEPGWLLTEVYNGNTRRSFLSVIRADRVADGPVANIHLEHHVPSSMHGFWRDEYRA
jgi:all-trans-8'-apo-beta-carotenal 15,15'-oxygenase